MNTFLCRHNRLKRGNCFQVEIFHGQINEVNQGIDRVYRLCLMIMIPQILSGAYNSRKIGCCMKISLLFIQSAFIYPSSKLTCFGTLEVRTERSLSITLSTLISSFRYILDWTYKYLNIIRPYYNLSR